MPTLPSLPITEALPELVLALAQGRQVVLEAPPGAGKSTVVPLALLDAPWRGDDRIVMLEPRRLAARAVAERMAATLGEAAGSTSSTSATCRATSGSRWRSIASATCGPTCACW